MTVQLTECTPSTQTVVRARFTGAEIVPAEVPSYLGPAITPNFAEIIYEHRVVEDTEGWTSHSWFCVSTYLEGPCVLKPGPDGEAQVNYRITAPRAWSVGIKDAEDLTVTARNELPEFLAAMIEGLRPSGEIHTTSF